MIPLEIHHIMVPQWISYPLSALLLASGYVRFWPLILFVGLWGLRGYPNKDVVYIMMCIGN